jgi:UDP-N-acetylmuramate--alanine ligase
VKALSGFQGVGRRLQRYGDVKLDADRTVTMLDDYGHHPVEMRVTLDALRGAFPGRRLLLAFQPHRYTRTRDLFDNFVEVLCTVDELLLADVYAAGEAPIVGKDGHALYQAVCAKRKRKAGNAGFVEKIADMPAAIRAAARDGDVVVTMGAGSIGGVPGQLAQTKVRGQGRKK